MRDSRELRAVPTCLALFSGHLFEAPKRGVLRSFLLLYRCRFTRFAYKGYARGFPVPRFFCLSSFLGVPLLSELLACTPVGWPASLRRSPICAFSFSRGRCHGCVGLSASPRRPSRRSLYCTGYCSLNCTCPSGAPCALVCLCLLVGQAKKPPSGDSCA